MADLSSLIESLELHVVYGAAPGSFTLAVLENDLAEALSRSDGTSHFHLHPMMSFLVNYAPSASWGSPDKVREWMKHGGLTRWQEISEELRAHLIAKASAGAKHEPAHAPIYYG